VFFGKGGVVSLLLDRGSFTERTILNCCLRIFEVARRGHSRLMSQRNISRWIFLFFLAALVSGGASGADSKSGVDSKTGVDYKTTALSSVGPGVPFAIGDLDGDLRPDLANIQTGQSDVSQTDYWIQLQLTAAQRQTILVVAPTGGLQIVARDVNGDHALDLVLTTAWLKEPVAILLNDGHGVFSRVDPRAYPGAFHEPETNWRVPAEPVLSVVGIPLQPRAGQLSTGLRLPYPRSRIDAIAASSVGFPFSPVFVSNLGRAPPSEVPSL
jgi:hypothetical protein